MTRVLVLGGTGWLGREIAAAHLDAGAEVICLARGDSGAVAEGARLVTADRRDPDAYAALTGDWDEVVEISYEPTFVTSALDALADRAAHWTLVSSASVYADHDIPDADESARLVEPLDTSQYPDAKVAAERATASRMGDRALIARAGLIGGPGDPSDRFGYWAARLHLGGRVIVPETEGQYVQVIEVTDLAAWIAHAGPTGHTGSVNAVGTSTPMDAFLKLAVEVTGFTGELVAVSNEELLAHEVAYWAGPRSLPLWLPPDHGGFSRRSGSRFRASGGQLSSLADTIARTLADEVNRDARRERRAGLTLADEQAILAELG